MFLSLLSFSLARFVPVTASMPEITFLGGGGGAGRSKFSYNCFSLYVM